jgi:hypothetical protein
LEIDPEEGDQGPARTLGPVEKRKERNFVIYAG